MLEKTLLITYDLRKPGRDYTAVHTTIKTAGTWAKLTESAWLIRTSSSAGYWRDKLKSVVDANDKVAVFSVSGDWATLGLDGDVVTWIHQHV
jgi:hypothetical protein